MSVGNTVNKPTLDYKLTEAMQSLRMGFEKCKALQDYLDLNPVVNGVDPLTASPGPMMDQGMGYAPEEAALIRQVVRQLVVLSQDAVVPSMRKFTGLD